jgi:hypothetical protein
VTAIVAATSFLVVVLMPRITLATIILLVLSPLVSKAESLGENILSKTSLQEIRMSHQQREDRKAELASPKTWPCFGASCSVLCAVGRHGIEFLPPYPAAIEPNLTAAERILPRLGFSWAPAPSVDQGNYILAFVLSSAELNKALECHDRQCTVAVNVLEGPDRQALAVCKAFRIGKQFGPPHQCEGVAVRNGPEWWVKIIDFVDRFPHENRMTKIHKLEVQGLPRPSILARIDKALSGTPLAMPDRSVKADRVVALAPRRSSQVLSGGWFEWAQVLVKLDEEFRVKVSLDLLVNKHNSDDPVDWHFPSGQQEAEYRGAIAKAITEELAPICVQPAWESPGILKCAKLRTMDGATIEVPEGASYGLDFEKELDPGVTRK